MLNQTTRRRVHELWDELTEFGASRNEHALDHALTVLSDLLDAQQAYWLGAVRLADAGRGDPASGWRPHSIRYLQSSPDFDALYREMRRQHNSGEVSPCIAPKVRDAGEFRVLIQHELYPGGWLGSSRHNASYAPLGIQDVIFVVMPLGADVESWFAFERIRHAQACFGERERALLDYAVRPLKWLHRHINLHHGVILADTPLSQSERRVLSSLLTEKTEQEIADERGLTPSTVHTYCKRICRKFNVRGRAGLTALWLGHLSAPQNAVPTEGAA